MLQLFLYGHLDWPGLAHSHQKVNELLAQYEQFLSTTNAEEEELIRQFMETKTSTSYIGAAFKFGDLVFDVLTSIGNGNRFHRLLVV